MWVRHIKAVSWDECFPNIPIISVLVYFNWHTCRSPKTLKENTLLIPFLILDRTAWHIGSKLWIAHRSLCPVLECHSNHDNILMEGQSQSEQFPKHLWCRMFYWIFPYWNHMIFFHLGNKHNSRSATCYKAFKQHKLVILRSSSHIHGYGQVSIPHVCISQGTHIMGRVMVGPTVKHMESCIWRSRGIIFLHRK